MTELPRRTGREFEAEMQSLLDRFRDMSEHCTRQVHLALDAFWTGSAEKRALVEAGDEQVNDEEKSLDELVLRILALRQPVATDLRILTASFKLITDLERVSDEAVGIAKAAAAGAPPAAMGLDRLKRMAKVSDQIVSEATGSFVRRDEAQAKAAFQMDAEVGSLYRDVIADITAFASQHSDLAAKSLGAMNVARCLERIADHAANIAEGTLFVIHDDQMPR